MKILKRVEESEVWNHWKKIENWIDDDFRSDIRDPLPKSLEWCLAKIEAHDIQNLYIISSSNWSEISDGKFLTEIVAKNIKRSFSNVETLKIQKNILEKIKLVEQGKLLDPKLILVTDNKDGLCTLIEGNRRSVAFLLTNQLINKEVYLGISTEIKQYGWAKNTYKPKP